MLLHILESSLIHRENTVLSTGLNGHIADGKAVIHGQILNALSRKFHGAVQGTVHTDHADDM